MLPVILKAMRIEWMAQLSYPAQVFLDAGPSLFHSIIGCRKWGRGGAPVDGGQFVIQFLKSRTCAEETSQVTVSTVENKLL